jgi:hypothetical protein
MVFEIAEMNSYCTLSLGGGASVPCRIAPVPG